MKSAYELAMERLSKSSPAVKLTAEQKKQLAELDSQYAAKVAEREITLNDEIRRLAQSGDMEKMQEVQQQLARDRKSLQVELESKKERVRDAKS